MPHYTAFPKTCVFTEAFLVENFTGLDPHEKHLGNTGLQIQSIFPVMINFVCQFDWAMECLIIWSVTIWVVSMSVFLDSISV